MVLTAPDVFHVIGGEATFVTGGNVIDPNDESTGETRDSRIEGRTAADAEEGRRHRHSARRPPLVLGGEGDRRLLRGEGHGAGVGGGEARGIGAHRCRRAAVDPVPGPEARGIP
jgi:hypothetical protein